MKQLGSIRTGSRKGNFFFKFVIQEFDKISILQESFSFSFPFIVALSILKKETVPLQHFVLVVRGYLRISEVSISFLGQLLAYVVFSVLIFAALLTDFFSFC